MKGILTKLDTGWFVNHIEEGEWKTYYPIYQHDFDISNKQQIIPLKEGDKVDFKIEKFWETGLEYPIYIATLLTPPYVSDDFQIGPDGAYEHTDDGLDEFHYHEVMDRLTLISDVLDRHILSHPICDKHPEIQEMINKILDDIVDVYSKVSNIN